METNINDIGYYRELLKRRKWYLVVPFVLVFAASTAVAVMLPSVYRSQATILVEAQNIPEELIRTTVTGYIEERLQTLSQIVLSRRNLEEIVDSFDLYPEMAERNTVEQIVARMRRDILMEPIYAQAGNPRQGRATIAFNLSYEGSDPQSTAQVANALVSLYLEQNLRTREERAEGTVTFFQQQLEELRRDIDSRENDIARFKEENLHSLPDLMQFNMQMLERTRSEIDNRQRDIHNLMNRLVNLQGQLALVEPVRFRGGSGRAMSLEEELRFLNNQYLALKAVKADNHPDLVRLRNQMKSLDQETQSRHSLRDLIVHLESKQNELSLLRERYSLQHPDVIRLSREIELLEAQVQELSGQRHLVTRVEDLEPENPAFINLQTQITSTQLDIESTRDKIRDLERTYVMYQRRIENSPQVEQRFKALQRDYDSAQKAFAETTSRLQAAIEARELEEGQMAEKLTVIEPPRASETPVKPNRKAIVLLGFVFASGLSVGTTALAEYFDSSVRDGRTLAKVSGTPVLGSIPYLRTKKDVWTIRIMRLAVLLGILLGVAGVLLLIHFYYEPLDVFWLKLQGRVGLN